VDVSFDTVTTIFPFTESNRLTPIAIGSATRIKSLPNVPTLAELGYRDIIGSVWIGVFVQRGTPATVVKKLEAELERVVRDPETSQRLEIAGLYARYADSAGYADILVKDTAEIEKVVRFSGLQPS
jgi:tripartite-type tricarboxylate transporter receptor subunit TctC